ncbi:Uncharacterised protein [Vibrio cholerae]|nr:Uncharacterised protein [Vibrio cholerae]CSD38563.1 Uncharacterised protein [Vibrio cholerae]
MNSCSACNSCSNQRAARAAESDCSEIWLEWLTTNSPWKRCSELGLGMRQSSAAVTSGIWLRSRNGDARTIGLTATLIRSTGCLSLSWTNACFTPSV